MATAKPKATPPRTPPTPQQIMAEQKRQAEKDYQAAQARLPAKEPKLPAKILTITVPDKTPAQSYLDEIAPASIVGRMIKFNIKENAFVTPDDDEKIADAINFTALCDQTLVGWIKFNGEGTAPDRAMGLLYDGFILPPRESLGDDDQAKWEIGLDGQPADPWQHQVYLVLQRPDTQELYTFVTSSKTGRRAVGTLLRHYDRLQKTHPDMYPVIRLKAGGFNHRDPRIGWVPAPVFAVVGRAQKDTATAPDTSLRADLNDELPL